MPISHDQNFKNLILDYPRQALAFLAAQEAADLDPAAVITPIRQEQLKDRLGDRFFELDVPLLVEWPNGRREALVFIVEEETEPRRFSIMRLASYCLAVADSCRTRRIVPVVVFLRAGRGVEQALRLGTERDTYLNFHYIARVLPELPAEAYLQSDNVVARVNLPLMNRAAGQKLAVYHEAIQGLLQLEADTDKRYKYLDYIDMYGDLDDNERQEYAERYLKEGGQMAGYFQTMREEATRQGVQRGVQQGMQQGMQRGQQEILARQLRRRFGDLDAATQSRLEQATPAELALWADRILDATSLEDVFRLQ